ncbi:molybdate ABC transporter substrate-binding protein [Vibrio sonorensis]|uniref:molybdate ABC transporter substrate-binding protein n=1 Tax=Vibrio sonorensis TaxID=1004316 RepID=UPI0008DA1A28|nr:molybdate ABC transporter substrate-binding protein [Vibrio sonorensis]
MARIISITLFLFSLINVAQAAESIRIFAASSMTNVVNNIADTFERQHGVKVVRVFGSSSSLARQIASGAPADVYISANQRWMEYVQKSKDLSSRNITTLASNAIVLVSSDPNIPAFDLTDQKAWSVYLAHSRLVVGQPTSVPLGIYSKQALEKLEVWSSIRKKIAPVHNARVALTLLERKEAKLGIIYKTDALLSDAVTIIGEFPVELHDSIEYPAANISSTQLAKDFLKYLESEYVSNILISYGFLR